MNVATVDCTSAEGSPLCELFGIRAFPTLMYLPPNNKVYHKFPGNRDMASLEKFALKDGWK